jgi:nicotinamide mononucleotide transporter
MILSILYILLARKQSLWCWPAAFISTLIYSIIFFDAALLMDSALNVYYLIMAVFGWYSWKYMGKLEEKELEITTYGLKSNIKIIILLSFISLIFGFLMSTYTSADFAYIDSFTTIFAVFATYMLTKKVLENWIYWIVIDIISIYIYIEKGFNVTVILFGIYTIIAFFAFVQWKKEYESKTSTTI